MRWRPRLSLPPVLWTLTLGVLDLEIAPRVCRVSATVTKFLREKTNLGKMYFGSGF